MTGKERIHCTLDHNEPDRVPYDLAGTTVTGITKNAYIRAMQFRGFSSAVSGEDIDPIQQIVTPSEENLRLLHVDTRRIGARRIFDYQNKEAEAGDMEEVQDFYGCKWQFNHKKDFYFNQVTFPLKDNESLSGSLNLIRKISWPEYKKVLCSDLDRQIKNIGDSCCIADRNTAGFTENSLRIRGYEKWFVDTLVDLQGVGDLLDIILEDKIRYWDELFDWAENTGNHAGISIISECDDLGTQAATILDPELLRKTVIPRIRILFSHIRKRAPHARIFFHSCGSIRSLIPDLIDAGMDILNPVQFTASGMELEGLKKDFGKSITFWGGGVDTQSTLNNGTPAEVKDEVKRIIDIMAPGGGFVFAPVHNIQDDVPPDNFWAMWETLQQYGG